MDHAAGLGRRGHHARSACIAQNTAIGTGKTDVAGYLILSKRFGDLDVSLDGSYTARPVRRGAREQGGVTGERGLDDNQAVLLHPGFMLAHSFQ